MAPMYITEGFDSTATYPTVFGITIWVFPVDEHDDFGLTDQALNHGK